MNKMTTEIIPGKMTFPKKKTEKIKVLIVDDAAFMRKAILDLLGTDAQIEVIGTARNGREALEQIDRLQPDVITLDIDMPIMDGLTGIRHIMIKCPLPIVVLSSLFNDGSITFEALRLGVVDFIPKPSGAVSPDIDRSRRQIIDRIKMASEVSLNNLRRVRLPRLEQKENFSRYSYQPLDYLVAIGTTLGGPNTIIRLLSSLAPTLPAALVVALELSPEIISAFVQRLDLLLPWEVCEVRDGLPLRSGVCYIGSCRQTIGLQNHDEKTITLKPGGEECEPLNRLFTAAAEGFQNHAVGVLLTGIGTDGADGLARIQKFSGVTIAQATESCVYPNLTENAIKRGTINLVLDEFELPQTLMSIING
ncbi:MAG: chemotaxis protein CheB [Deltaproteobacteria bacterium]|nr:chemotaxis protein CheB [Deltaproteobacteria bacterium]